MCTGYGLSQVIPHDTVIKQHEGYLSQFMEGRIKVGSTQKMHSETTLDGPPSYPLDAPEYDIPIPGIEKIKDMNVRELKSALAAHIPPLSTQG